MSLNLIKIDPPHERNALGVLLSNLRTRGGIEPRDLSLKEILARASDPNHLIRRFGLRQVISVYEKRFLPALGRLPVDSQVWRARYELKYHLAQMVRYDNRPRKLAELLLEMIADLNAATFGDNPEGTERLKEDLAARNQIRHALAVMLADAARSLEHGAQPAEALKCYEAIEKIGAMNAEHRSGYVSLLWRKRDVSPAAISIYLRHLYDKRLQAGHDAQLREMSEFISSQLTVDDRVPQSQLAQRLLFNQAALCGADHTSKTLRHIGLAYLRLDQQERAVEYLRRAQSANGGDGGAASFYLGQALFQAEKFDEGVAAFQQAAAQGFDQSRIAAYQGIAYARARLRDKALQVFSLAEEEGREQLKGEFYIQRGRASFLMGDAAEAERYFRKSLEEDAADWRAAYGLAICLEHFGRRAEAIEMLRHTAEAFKDAAPPFHLLGRLLQKEGRARDSVKCFKRAVELCPEDTEYLLSLGTALDDSGGEGLSYLERAAEAGTGGPEVVRRVMLGHLNNDRRGKARYWLKVLAADENSSSEIAEYNARELASQATDAFNTGKYQQSVELWEQVQRTFSEQASVGERLALALTCSATVELRRGQIDCLKERTERALSLSTTAQSQFLHAISCMVYGDFISSEESFSALAARHPDQSAYVELKKFAALLSIGDETIAEVLKEIEGGPLQHLLDGVRKSLTTFVRPFLPAVEGSRIKDDLPWPTPLPPFELVYEPMDKAILRDR